MIEVELNKSHCELLLYIEGLCKDTGKCSFSYADVSHHLKVNERHVFRLVRFLIDNSFIRIISSGGGRGITNIYTLVDREST